MAKIVKPEIRNAGFLNRGVPCAVGHLPRNRLTTIGKAEHRMLATLSFLATHRNQLRNTWHVINQELPDHIDGVRSGAETVKQAQNSKSHPRHVPTMAVMQELLRPIFLDKTLGIDRNDAGDIHHAIISIAHCDYVLLDGTWEDLFGRMLRRFTELGLQTRVAKVFSKRRQGIKLFLKELENGVGNAA